MSARKRAGSRPKPARPWQGRFIHECAGGIGCRTATAVRPVGIGRDRGNPLPARKSDGERQCVLLIGAATAAAFERHGKLTTGQNHRTATFAGEPKRKVRVLGRNLTRFSFEIGAEQNGLIADRAGDVGSRCKRFCRACNDMKRGVRERVVAGLRTFVRRIVKCRNDRSRRMQFARRDDCARVSKRRGVGYCGT